MMTEQEANKRLKDKEREYLDNYSPVCETTYCAVVKQSNDFSIQNDFYIEIGLSNFEVLVDKILPIKNQNVEQLILNSIIAEDFKDEYKDGISQPVDSDKIGLLSNSLKRSKLTGGCSVFYESNDIKTGTVGAFFKLKSGQEIYMLSNRHVIVDPDFEDETKVVHPSRMDSTKEYPSETIGNIYWTSKANDDTLDAAIAMVHYPVEIGRYSLCHNIKHLSLGMAKIGQNISKFGRTSGITYGEIRSVNCTVNVTENINKPQIFRHQILTTKMGSPGDSGSVIVNDHYEVVGLLFAGSKKKSSFSNHLGNIFNKRYIDNFSKFV